MNLQELRIDRRSRPRRHRSPWPLRAVVTLALTGLIWLFWTPVRAFVDRVQLPEVKAYLVTEASAATAAALRGTAANGYVVAARRAALSSDVPGRIVEMAVREGSVVRKGDVVARLYAEEYRAALARAEADAEAAAAAVARAEALATERRAEADQADNAARSANARVDEAAAELTYARAEHERQQRLVADGIGSSRDLERAKADLDAAEARQRTASTERRTAELAAATAHHRITTAKREITVAEKQLAAARATRDQARAALDKTDVRAPFDGVVVLKDAEVGEVVSPNVVGGGTARGAVCTMVDFASLEIQAEVPETTLGSVRLGGPVDVFLDAWPDEKLSGRVDRIWPTADRSKATVEVRIVVDDRERLRPEYGCRIVFRPEDEPTAVEASLSAERRILIPESSIVEFDGVSTVFVIERDVVRATAVTVGERRNNRAAIDTGLRPGQRIVAAPPPTLQDGDRVRLVRD